MSNTPETDFDLELHFLPAWAQKAQDPNRFANYAGSPDRNREGDPRRRDGRDRPRRPEGQRPGGGGGQRRSDGPRGRGGRPDRNRGGDQRGPRRDAPQRPEPLPLPELHAAIIPDDKGVDSLARQIRMTGRAYPLFDIAQLFLQKPERHAVTFSIKKKPDGTAVQPLYLCALDDTLWLEQDEAVQWLLEKHFDTFYQAEKTQIDPPKGTYTFVAQCGMSGAILGPPNYHDYQTRLHKLHAERFSRMPFDMFKARVKIVKDEATVKKWLDEQSWKTEYICLNMPEPLKLPSREEVEKHFREVHLPNLVKEVESHRLSGPASRGIRSQGLARLVRHTWEQQRRFPLQVATVLSQQFATRGLQFFKVNKTVTHVAIARPHYLDLDAVPVSEGVKRIVDYINTHPKCTRRHVIEALAPMSQSSPPPAPAAPTEGAATEGSPAAAPAETPQGTPEQMAVNADLHWLIHQGHVLEFATGILETAKKPLPRPPKPQPAAKPHSDVPPPNGEGNKDGGSPAETAPEGAPPTASELASEEPQVSEGASRAIEETPAHAEAPPEEQPS